MVRRLLGDFEKIPRGQQARVVLTAPLVIPLICLAMLLVYIGAALSLIARVCWCDEPWRAFKDIPSGIREAMKYWS